MFNKNNFSFKSVFFKSSLSRFLSLFALIFSILYIWGVDSASAYTSSLTTSGVISLDVSTSGNSANVATDNITVSSTCPLGYTLSIKGPADSTLYKVNEQTGLADKANSSPSSKIIPTMGTKENPLPIIGEDGSGNSYLGTWGYSMTNNLATGTFIGLNDTMSELTTKSSASGNGLTGAEATTTDTYPVYYGVSVAPTTEAGQYKLAESTAGVNDNVITYQLTMPIGCNQYNIVYNGNGTTASPTTGSTTTSVATHDAPHTLTSNGFARTGYTFLGWSTSSTATTAEYTNGQALTAEQVNSLVSGLNDGETKTLYAVWQINTYPIAYHGNGATSGSTAATTATYNTAHALRANGFARTGYTFLGWSTASNATSATYTNGQTLTAAQINSLVNGLANGGTRTLYAVWRINSYTVTWNGNGGAPSEASRTRNHNAAIGTLPTATRANYVFAGWWNTSAASGGTQVTTATTVTANVTYWARWTPMTIANISYMQDMNSTICANTAVNATRTLTDRRDNNTYTIKKLADSKCWMTQNLRLVGSRTLTSADSNVSSNFTLPASSTSWGTTNTNVARIYNTGDTSHGVYYNWYAATAGTGTAAMTSGNATASVCSKGWRLPTPAEFQTLYNAYGSYNSLVSATSAVLSGGWYNTSGTGRNVSANWWGSTASNGTNASSLIFSNSTVQPYGGSNKIGGFSVRCIAN